MGSPWRSGPSEVLRRLCPERAPEGNVRAGGRGLCLVARGAEPAVSATRRQGPLRAYLMASTYADAVFPFDGLRKGPRSLHL